MANINEKDYPAGMKKYRITTEVWVVDNEIMLSKVVAQREYIEGKGGDNGEDEEDDEE